MRTNQAQNKSQSKKKNAVYVKPAIEVIEMEMEGILCASGSDYNPGGGWGD